MPYAHSTFRTVEVLEDLLDALGPLHLSPHAEDKVAQAYDVLNAMHEETDDIRLAAASLRESDGTYTMTGIRIRRGAGYQVGGVVPTLVDPTNAELYDWVEAARRLDVPGTVFYLGSWTDDEGRVHFDVSTLEQDLQEALALGIEREEEAIWDWFNSDCVYTGVRSI